jgi:anthranilate phosphoribosyltransferase
MSLLPFLYRLMDRESLPESEARHAMSAVLRGEATVAQIAAFLVALRMKGETPAELVGFARAMRDNMIRVDPGPLDGPLLDTCGTGGDAQSTLNVSTLAAFVVAGAGVKVAKHGNRSITSRCGSADLLEALGARIDLTPNQTAQSMRETGFGFLFAPALHPAMKHAAAARAELKTRTAFNLLGPLANPAGANVQLVGAPSVQTAELLAVALSSLGLQKGFVVHGAGGLDEISTLGATDVFAVVGGAIDHHTVTPEDFGVERTTIEQIRGGDINANVDIARAVLSGSPGPFRDIVLVNAAAALVAASKAPGYREAMDLAVHSVDSGAARGTLQRFSEFTRSAAALS